jgi:heat shock protein HslJ
MRNSLLILSVLLLFVNCVCTKSADENNDVSSVPLLSDQYNIVLINDQNVENRELTMNFDKLTNNVSGNAGCNQYFGGFQQENKSVTFSKLGATKKYCPDPEIRRIENQLIALLPNIKWMDSDKSGNINFYNGQSELVLSIKIMN